MDPWVGKIPWRTSWQPTPVFLPGQFHGQRSLAGYSPCGREESDTTERLSTMLATLKSVLPYISIPVPDFKHFYQSIVDLQCCVSGKQQSESVIHIHILTLVKIFSPYWSI